MKYSKELNIEVGNAICYSGFREGQNPGGLYPTYEEVLEDLLKQPWQYSNVAFVHLIIQKFFFQKN